MAEHPLETLAAVGVGPRPELAEETLATRTAQPVGRDGQPLVCDGGRLARRVRARGVGVEILVELDHGVAAATI